MSFVIARRSWPYGNAAVEAAVDSLEELSLNMLPASWQCVKRLQGARLHAAFDELTQRGEAEVIRDGDCMQVLLSTGGRTDEEEATLLACAEKEQAESGRHGPYSLLSVDMEECLYCGPKDVYHDALSYFSTARLPEGFASDGRTVGSTVHGPVDPFEKVHHSHLSRSDRPGVTYIARLGVCSIARNYEYEGVTAIVGVRISELDEWVSEIDPTREVAASWEEKLIAALWCGNLASTLAAIGRVPLAMLDPAAVGLPVPPLNGSIARVKDELPAFANSVVDRLPPFDPARGRIHATPHLAEARFNLFAPPPGHEVPELTQQWLVFDDLWVGQHPALARSIVRVASRWDVLSNW